MFVCEFHNVQKNKVKEKESPATYQYISFTKIVSLEDHIKELYTKMVKEQGKRGLSLSIIKPVR